MKKLDKLLDEYGESHQHPVNKLIHWVCVPLIMWSLLGLLWSLPVPAVLFTLPLPLNWAILMAIVSMAYYLRVSPGLAIGILLVITGMLTLTYAVEQTGASLWIVSVLVFVVAWIGQFIGHIIEGKRPSFFKDIQFLLIGPLWLLCFVYKKLNLGY